MLPAVGKISYRRPMQMLNRNQILSAEFDEGSDLIVVTAAGLRISFTGEHADKAALAKLIVAPNSSDFIEVPKGLKMLILGEWKKAS
jgi:hypothetical protein